MTSKKDEITHDIDAHGHLIEGSPLDKRMRYLEAEVEKLRGERKILMSTLYGRFGDGDSSENKPSFGRVEYYDISSKYPESMRRDHDVFRRWNTESRSFLSVEAIEAYDATSYDCGEMIELTSENIYVYYVLDRQASLLVDGKNVLSVGPKGSCGRWVRIGHKDGTPFPGNSQ